MFEDTLSQKCNITYFPYIFFLFMADVVGLQTVKQHGVVHQWIIFQDNPTL